MEGQATLLPPENPALAAMAVALHDAGHWAEIVDRDWRLVYATDDLRRIYGGLTDLASVALGAHYFGPEAMSARLRWRSGPNRLELIREMFGVLGGSILADTVAKAARRPAAILFADLEASTPLARRLSTASYFALGRRLARTRRTP